jgi:RNA polymerase sigma-70 factor (sigma-E family)
VSVAEVRARPEATGGPAGLAELYAAHAQGALRLAYMLTGHRETAEDLVQDAFVKLAGRFVHLRKPEAFDAYLRTMIVNRFLSNLRRRKLERAQLERERAEAGRPPVPADIGERDEMWQALRQLPERQRAALVLRYYEDLSEQDAAAVLGCSKPALKSLVARGMETLRGLVKQVEER